MVSFSSWPQAIFFALIFSVIILVPCVLVALMGVKMIDKLGNYPTQTPVIQMSIFFQLVGIEITTFFLLIGFLHFFSCNL